MPTLEKAKLTEISADPKNPRDLSAPMDVQFNPTTMKLALSNQAEGGSAQTRPQRQYLGSGSRTLSLDLVFDTADEGETGAPRSVRERTALVERFALPRKLGDNKQAPPKARFEWGPLVVEGIVEGVNIDLDHFAADGTPLRAKVSMTIKEQDASFELLESGAGANPAGSAPTPTAAASGAPGTSGSGTDRVGVALGGESAADFAVRMGLDPGAWRGLAAGLDATLSLEAGLQIGFSASLGAGLGVGLTAGLAAGVGASLGASFGLTADLNLGLELAASGQFGAQVGADLGGGRAAAGQPGSAAAVANGARPPAAGFSLAAAGGLGAAIESVKSAQADAGQRAARAAFADPAGSGGASATTAASATTTGSAGRGPGTGLARGTSGPGQSASPLATSAAPGTAPAPVRPGMPQQPRPPLTQTGFPTPGTRAGAAPPPPQADPRAAAFGRGVPLRPTYGEAARRRAQGDLGLPPTTDDPQVPHWRALVAVGSAPGSAPGGARTGGCGCACPPLVSRTGR